MAYFGDLYQCSRDCVGELFSSMISDAVLAVACGKDTMLKATSFYDNEMGFCHRMVELALLMIAA